MASNDPIDFDLIEGQKENIQSLPGGRSAKKLAQVYSPSPLGKLATPTPSDTRSVNDCIRAEYEAEIQNLAESDDPLDVFDRYVRWTLDAYPSAQATPQSQLHTLLERATKAFISSSQYKNDPRYLKMWMHYIQFFSDSPRETYLFLSRHAIGERLALFYEEYAAWLEGAGRWSQAEEVYKLGIEQEARPVQRLLRKFKEFEERRAQQPEGSDEPSSPAFPTVRPALAMKVDPFGAAAASSPRDPQAQRQSGASRSTKPPKAKLAIFSDADAKPSVLSTKETGSKGWDTIGSMAERKKENTIEPKPWAGETLKAGGKKPAAEKLSVFRDASLAQIQNIVVVPSKNQVTVHPQTGKRERIFANLSVLYPTPEEPGTELCFEEVMAAHRGWLDYDWGRVAEDRNKAQRQQPERVIEEVTKAVSEKLVIHHDVPMDENGQRVEPPRQSKAGRKKKMMEVNETQIIKAKLDSPSGPKLRKKHTSEPTMTLHTRAATDDIYDIFNAPLKQPSMGEDDESDNYDSDDYTTDAESATRQLDNDDVEEEEEEDENEAGDEEEDDLRSVSEWSDFNTHKHIPLAEGQEEGHDEVNATQATDLVDRTFQRDGSIDQEEYDEQEDEENMSAVGLSPPRTRTSFVPILPEDYDPPPTRPYRDAAEIANNRLPFMTPITERTEVSLDIEVQQRRDQFKTPCKQDGMAIFRDDPEQDGEPSDLEAMSSPLREILSNERPVAKTPLQPASVLALNTASSKKPLRAKGPIIKDAQCNPVDEEIRKQILSQTQPPLDSFRGFYHHREEKFERGSDIRKFARTFRRTSRGSSGDKAVSPPAPVIIEFPDNSASYVLKRELGAGAYAPVYLVENQDPDEEAETDENAVVTMGRGSFAVNRRSEFEALKMETPPSAWEFYMMRVAHNRLGPQHRASASLSYAHEMHLYQDEGYLFLPYHPHGTILDVVNLFRAEASGVMDEQLAMFFTIELMRTVESLHAKGVLHGDIKPDNCLLRLDTAINGSQEQRTAQSLNSQWKADGTGGWDSRGITLIDFGRAIDMRAFMPDVQFIAEWKTTAQDCAEMREGRPWTWQVDYHGLAGTIHCLLFGKYIETIRCDEGGLTRGGRRYRIRESLKRYWQTDLWSECFEVLLNPSSFVEAEEGGQMPVLKSMRGLREKMETWLEDNSEKGVGLKSLMGRLEAFAKTRK
ncbi:unnamed protein product [Clonostachys byssicola]|uniref:Checkpoint serine/threonine-protein kinase bub1 n=1 Tax=Clonostachys byssicola TaxID=160290 RepID=A0A9N9YC23_9HYPO|nr:unnamed protein product [Clonostachys byssicola]